jgi:cell division protein FtsB
MVLEVDKEQLEMLKGGIQLMVLEVQMLLGEVVLIFLLVLMEVLLVNGTRTYVVVVRLLTT